MDQLAEYIINSPEIKNIVFIGGKSLYSKTVRALINKSNIKSVSVYSDSKKNVKSIMNFVESLEENTTNKICDLNFFSLKDLDNLSSLTDDTALVFKNPDDIDLIIKLNRLNPKYLCGEMPSQYTTSFEIWEAYRNCCKEMHIITKREDKTPEVLHWKKNPSNPIELSVIFPMYNIATYLPKCIESVTAWKADYVEYLFVDDGSPDNCADIVKEAAQNDNRIKLIQKENGGCASARQLGLEKANGRYVGFIDPDDYIDESMFRKLLRRAFIGSYEISYCGYKELYEALNTTKDIPDLIDMPYSDGTTDKEKIYELVAYLRCAIWRGIYLKSMIIENNIHFYTDLRRFDDLPFKVETLAVAKSVVSTPEYLYYYRMARPGQDIAANDERLFVHFPIFHHLDEFAKKHSSKEFIEKLQIVKLHTHIYAIKKLLPEFIPEYVHKARLDLLRNMGFGHCLTLYKSAVGKSDFAFFVAIATKNPSAVKKLCDKMNNISDKRNKNQNNLSATFNKFGNF